MEINYEKFNKYELLFILQMEIDFLNCFFDIKDVEDRIREKDVEDEFASYGFYDLSVEYDDEEYPNFIQDYYLKDIDNCRDYKKLFLETFNDLLDEDFYVEYEEEKSYLDNFFSDELEEDYIEAYLSNLDMFYNRELLKSLSNKNLEIIADYLKNQGDSSSYESVSIKNLEKELRRRS
jgi:hypothetical protein